jgi:hypothetical protein
VVNLPDWPTLPAEQAVNFANDGSLKPVLIRKAEDDVWTIEDAGTGHKASKRLYRVWGDWAATAFDWAAWDIARYWTDEAPESEDDFYGKTAVEFHWNSGRYVAQLKNAGLITEIRGWSGTVAGQPAENMTPQHRPTGQLLDNYHLPGGWTQYFIPTGTLPWIDDYRTPWNLAVPARKTVVRPALQVAPPGKGAVADGRQYEALAILVEHLARLLEAASEEGAEFGFRNSPLTGQAATLLATGGQLRAHAGSLPDAAAKAQSRLIAQSLVGIARYLDGYPREGSYGGEIRDAIAEVVRWAYAVGVQA